VALPEQIRKQAEAADEIIRQLGTSGNNEIEDESNDSSDGFVADARVDRDDNVADENPVSDSAVHVPSGEQPRGTPNSADEDTYEQKYRSLQGMFNSQVPKLQQQNKDLVNRLQQMEQLIASLQTNQQQENTTPSVVSTPTGTRLVTEQDISDYGDSIDVMRRVSKEEVSSLLGRISAIEEALRGVQSNVVPQVNAVAQRQLATAEQLFWRGLGDAVPNWREINENADFQTWLLQTDPLTGITRQTYLEDAQRNYDVERVSNFFRTWLQNNSGQAVAQPSVSPNASVRTELERQVAPGRSKSSGQAPTQNQARIWTRPDISKFYDDVRRGNYVGREQERDRIERDIFVAQTEGRIQ
jgi:hypothetical protein